MAKRVKLLWYGRPPTPADIREAESRDLVIEEQTPNISPEFTYARAAVFWATVPYFESAIVALETRYAAAVNHGLYVYVVVATQGQLTEVRSILMKAHPQGESHGAYRVRTGKVSPHEVPQQALMWNPGSVANTDLFIETSPDLALADYHRLLLQRAFWDCKSIKLELIEGGFSGALTFYVKARLAASNAGDTPQPFFVKLHDSEKLRDEMLSFSEYAEYHVPWHLRPNFIPARCLYGVQHGILVGSLVQDSRSLWEVALGGDGPQHIRSLFTETLAVLRRDRQPVDAGIHGSVVEPLGQFCKPSQVPTKRVERATQFGGDIHSPTSLWRKLLNLPGREWLRSPIHGDLHANNVRVRKQDAIVIDFAHATRGPMCADLASLEVWLAFEWLATLDFDAAEWQQRIEHLYYPAEIMRMCTHDGNAADEHWLLPCIKEIRALAQDSILGPDEYARVLAVYLLRLASFPANERCAEGDEFRRAYAYWLANRLVVSLCDMRCLEPEVA